MSHVVHVGSLLFSHTLLGPLRVLFCLTVPPVVKVTPPVTRLCLVIYLECHSHPDLGPPTLSLVPRGDRGPEDLGFPVWIVFTTSSPQGSEDRRVSFFVCRGSFPTWVSSRDTSTTMIFERLRVGLSTPLSPRGRLCFEG